jgi:tRNA(Ile)-lysidine synthase
LNFCGKECQVSPFFVFKLCYRVLLKVKRLRQPAFFVAFLRFSKRQVSSMPMLEAFRDHLEQTGLIPPGVRVLVGYSGGADSTCLLHLLHSAGVDVVAGHLHHGQRAEADEEQRKCEEFCDQLGVPFATGRADIPAMSEDLKIGYEEAGRKARYSFFQQAAFRLSCPLIATAHTRTDHIETILLHLTRGSGLAGLAGIPIKRDSIIRPLLAFPREQTRAYCEERDFWFHDDPANEDLSFSRARVRHRIVPELQAINPAAEEAIARLAELADEEDRFLNGMAAAALEQTESGLNGALSFLTQDCEAAFDRGKLGTLPPVLFRRAIRLAVQALGASLERDHLAKIELGVSSLPNGAVTAEGGQVVVEWRDDLIHIRRLRPTEPFRYALTVPGETISDEFGWQFTAFHGEDHAQERASLKAVLPSAAVKGPLYFRTVQPGDQMKPLGFDGSRKLSDLMGEAKLSVAARARLPVVCDLVGPLWAPGVCLDHRVRLADHSGIAIVIEFGPVQEDASHNMETGV